jgi:hypothetical protein
LGAAGIGVTYNASGEYTAGQTGVFFGIMPPEPDRVVVVNVTPMTDDPGNPWGLVMVQLAMRGLPGNPLDVDDLASAIKTPLHGLTGVWFGSVYARQVYRKSSAPMGQDEAQRSIRADKYYLDCDYQPTPALPGWN